MERRLPGLMLAGLAVVDPTLAATPVHPGAGQAVTAAVTVANGGGSAGTFTVAGVLVLHGTTTPVESHLGTDSGNAPAGGQDVAVLQSGPMVTYNHIAGYDPATGYDLVLTLTDSGTGEQTVYTVESAVFAPAPVGTALLIVPTGTTGCHAGPWTITQQGGSTAVGSRLQLVARVTNVGPNAGAAIIGGLITTWDSPEVIGHIAPGTTTVMQPGDTGTVSLQSNGPMSAEYVGTQSLIVQLSNYADFYSPTLHPVGYYLNGNDLDSRCGQGGFPYNKLVMGVHVSVG